MAALPWRRLPRGFYARDTVTVARELLGMVLVHRVGADLRCGRIVEVEAYLGEHDLAAHTSRGLTQRNRSMFGPAGHAYVYMIYGMHHCMNTVTEKPGVGTGVLLRALAPLAGLEGVNATGPGRLCRAMGIDRGFDGRDLCRGGLYVAEPKDRSDVEIVAGPRIGVDYAGEWAAAPLRFHIAGERCVSRPR